MTKAPKPPADPDLPVTLLPPPPEPPPSQPEIPPAPPPSDFPTSSDSVEANFRTTALVVWGAIGAVILLGLVTMALTWRSAALPGLPDGPSVSLPEFEMPQIRMPEFDRPEGNVMRDPEPPEGMSRVENPRFAEPVGSVDKPEDARSAIAGPDHEPEDKVA